MNTLVFAGEDMHIENKGPLGMLTRFYTSNFYVFLCAVLALAGIMFCDAIIAATLIIVMMSGQFFVLRDSSRMFYPLTFLIMLLVNLSGENIERGSMLVFGAVPVIGGMIYNIIKHKKRFRPTMLFLPMAAVSVAVTVGGAFSITKEEYFEIGNLFYVGTLGFVMMLLCMLLFTLFDGEDAKTLQDSFVGAMCDSALLLGFVILYYYISNLSEFASDHQTVTELAHNPMRNVAVSYFMLAMPFAFYRAKDNAVYLLGGIFLWGTCLLSGSRTGLLFGSMQFFICMVAFIITSKKHRWLWAGILAGLVAVALVLKDDIFYMYLGRLEEDFGTGSFINPHESRFLLFKRAVEDFFSAPVFGRGLGYTGNEDIYVPRLFEMNWYHNFICQIAGSLGLFGIAAYMYQLYYRMQLLLKRPFVFCIPIGLMYIGALLSGITDTGIFTPFPTVFLLNCAFMITVISRRQKEQKEDIVKQTPINKTA